MSLVVLGLTAAIQLAVVLASGSVALLNDTLHNAADALTAVPLWLAFALGRRRPSARFPYGYGRAEDLAGLVVLGFIVASAAIGLYESVDRLVHPADVHLLAVVGLAGAVGFAGNEAVAQYRVRVGREIGSAALVADGTHARTDGFTSLGVVVGAVGVALGYPVADPIAGLVIALLMVVVLRDAARDVLMRMMDAVDPRIAERGAMILRDVPGVLDVGPMRIRWIGHRLVAEASVTVDRRIDVATAHEIAERARHALLHDVPHLSSVIIHPDPSDGSTDPHAAVAHHD